MLLPVVGCPNVFTNEEASFLSFVLVAFVEGASSGWSENIGLCDESDDSIVFVVEDDVVVEDDASSSTYEFTGTIGKDGW